MIKPYPEMLIKTMVCDDKKFLNSLNLRQLFQDSLQNSFSTHFYQGFRQVLGQGIQPGRIACSQNKRFHSERSKKRAFKRVVEEEYFSLIKITTHDSTILINHLLIKKRMHPAIQQLLQRPLKYNYHSGPDNVKCLKTAEEAGLNCGALIHLLTKELFQVELPSKLMCIELLYDQQYLRDISPQETPKLGDIVAVGRKGLTELLNAFEREYLKTSRILHIENHPRIHLLMYTGEVNSPGDPLLVHATPYAGGGVRIWPLPTVMNYGRYSHIYKWRRLNERQAPENPGGYLPGSSDWRLQ